MAPAPLGLVCLQYRPDSRIGGAALDDLNRELLARINATRRVHLTHTRLEDRYVIRVVVGQLQTGRAKVEEVWRLIKEAAATLA
jgi:aromatic-L-amino-acid decarboxylase